MGTQIRFYFLIFTPFKKGLSIISFLNIVLLHFKANIGHSYFGLSLQFNPIVSMLTRHIARHKAWPLLWWLTTTLISTTTPSPDSPWLADSEWWYVVFVYCLWSSYVKPFSKDKARIDCINLILSDHGGVWANRWICAFWLPQFTCAFLVSLLS